MSKAMFVACPNFQESASAGSGLPDRPKSCPAAGKASRNSDLCGGTPGNEIGINNLKT